MKCIPKQEFCFKCIRLQKNEKKVQKTIAPSRCVCVVELQLATAPQRRSAGRDIAG
jgi:hypothetical protein